VKSHHSPEFESDMPNRSTQAGDGISTLDLWLTDLRAHFEAQRRTVRRAEECLLRCRGAQNAVAFDAAADTFRDQLTVVAQNRKTIGALLSQIVAKAEHLKFAGRPPKALTGRPPRPSL
jgi:hypothetical protein